MTKTFLDLKEVEKSDIDFLYSLLLERDPKVNISHKKMPTLDEHTKFVQNHPYSKWYIIQNNETKMGSAYLTSQNEIGLFVKKEFQGKGIGKKALDLVIKLNPRERFLANINPENKESIEFFKKNNFRLIQFTYELDYPK